MYKHNGKPNGSDLMNLIFRNYWMKEAMIEIYGFNLNIIAAPIYLRMYYNKLEAITEM